MCGWWCVCVVGGVLVCVCVVGGVLVCVKMRQYVY